MREPVRNPPDLSVGSVKIGLTGAGGTGKTTVMRLVAKALGVPELPSVVRGVFEDFGVKHEAEQLAWQTERKWQLQRAIFDRRLKVESEYPNGFISDRTILDHLMYCYIRAAEAVSDATALDLESMVVENLRSYDVLVFFPAGQFVPSDDGFRQEGLAYQMLQDCFLRGFLDRHRIRHLQVEPGTPEQRARHVVKQIQWVESLAI